MTNLENQSPPEAEVGIMSGGTSLSKKQKLFGGIAAIAGFLVIGFGGFSAWQGLSSNAAGEDSLGNQAAVEAPVDSPYFKITAFDQQNVKLMATGEAQRQGTALFADGWRVERTTTPEDSASWKAALDSSVTSFTPESTEGQFAGMYDRSSFVIEPTQPQCGYCTGSGDLAARMRDPNTLQPGTTYHYRASKLADDGTTWTPQGPNVNITTLTYPTVNASIMSGDLLTTTWTESHPEGSGLGKEAIGEYSLVRTSDANLLKKYHQTPYDSNYTYLLPNEVTNAMNMTQERRLPAGTVAQAQPKSSTYYYAMVLRTGQGIVPVMDLQKVTTSASATTGLISATIAPATAAWTQQPTIKANITQLIPGKAGYTQYHLSSTQGTNTNKCPSWIIPSNTGQGQYITAVTTNMTVCASASNGLYAGAVKTSIKAFASTPGGQVEQTVNLSVAVTKVNTAITASYAKTTIKASNGGAYATINVKSPAISGQRPVGTVKIKNLSTGKFIYSYNSGNPFSIPTSMQVKPLLKPGKYRLALVFTEKNANGAYFNNKTINLPQLTVQK